MITKLSFFTAFLSGLVAPGIAWLIFGMLLSNSILPNKPAVPYLVSLLVNFLLMRYLLKNNKETAVYGLLCSTFIIAMFIFKFKL